MRYHTRINISPSGLRPECALTIGNLWAARINKQLAVATGGSFVVQFDNLLVAEESIAYHNDREPFIQAILSQLSHYGVSPTPAEHLRLLGLPPTPVVRESDCDAITQFVWRVLLPSLREACGDWPPPWLEGQHSNGEAIHLIGRPTDLGDQGMVSPYVVLSRLVMDLTSGRNLYFNGEDLVETRNLYHLLGVLLRVPVPKQYTVPLLRTDEAKISTSSEPDTNCFYVERAMNAGLTYHEFWGYLERVALKPGASFTHRDPPGMLNALRSHPVLDPDHWRKFLEATTDRRKAMIDEL